MANYEGTDQGVPDDHVNDGDAKAAAQILGEEAVSAAAAQEVRSGRAHTQLSLSPILPILLGVSICALNILVGARLWNTAYRSNATWFSRVNYPTTVFLALTSISFFVGLFLIIYAIFLRRVAPNHYEDKTPDDSRHTPTYVKWVFVPLLVALPAPALTVWAAQMVEPIAPKPCIELYQEAQNIRNDNPDFRMSGYDRDQIRCRINQSVLSE